MNQFGAADLAPETLAAIERLEQRVAALERALAEAQALPPLQVAAPAAPTMPAEVPAAEWNVPALVALSGRTLMVLGGAYLLRALSEGGALQPVSGVAAGFAYAAVWLALAWRAPSRLSASFHGASFALVAYPLLWEAITRFALITTSSGAFVLAGITGAALLTARWKQIETLAWFAALGATATAVALAIGTSTFIPYTVVVALVGVAALWLGYVDEWVGIRWPVAFAADVLVLLVTLRALSPNVAGATGETLTLQLLVLALYLGSFVARTLVLGREVIPFEVAQSAAAMSVCFGGALAVLANARVSATPLGVAAVLLGVGAYAFSFVYVEPKKHWRNLTFFASHALAFVLAGMVILLPRPGIAVAAAGLAIACAEWTRRSGRLTLAVHAFVFATACAWASGLLAAATSALVGAVAEAQGINVLMLAALATVAACAAWPVTPALRQAARPGARALRTLRMSLLVAMVSGSAILLALPLGGYAGETLEPGIVAAVRTVTLTLAAAALVFWNAEVERPEYRWIAFALLALVGLKLLFEDLPNGRPATLFVALAVYGAALVLVPRYRHSGA